MKAVRLAFLLDIWVSWVDVVEGMTCSLFCVADCVSCSSSSCCCCCFFFCFFSSFFFFSFVDVSAKLPMAAEYSVSVARELEDNSDVSTIGDE